MSSAWTADRLDTLKTLLAHGLSASQIAAAFGDCTRNAVIGAVGRSDDLAFTKRPNGQGPRPDVRIRKEKPKPTTARAPATPLPEPPRERLPTGELMPLKIPTSIDDLAIPIKQRRSLAALTRHTCRWPVGDVGEPGFFFCGAEPIAGKPYCPAHHAVAYQPARQREPNAQRVAYLTGANARHYDPVERMGAGA